MENVVFQPDNLTRVEDTLVEVLAYTYGLGIAQGTHDQQIDFVNKVVSIPLYQMFNLNTLGILEDEIITNSQKRDFVLNFYTRFITILKIRHRDFDENELILLMANICITKINIGNYNKENNPTLVKSLKNAILPTSNDFPLKYLRDNVWYVGVILLNVFSISVLKVMDDVRRPIV